MLVHKNVISCHQKSLLAYLKHEPSKKLVRNYLICFKHKPKLNFNLVGELPNNNKERVIAAIAFNITEIDYAAPFFNKR